MQHAAAAGLRVWFAADGRRGGSTVVDLLLAAVAAGGSRFSAALWHCSCHGAHPARLAAAAPGPATEPCVAQQRQAGTEEPAEQAAATAPPLAAAAAAAASCAAAEARA